MTYPRSQLVAEGEPGFYHVVSRCVRRAFLCGWDRVTGQSYEHRRQWIEARILELAECFSVSVYAYAVMSNHVHIVLHVDPTAVEDFSDQEVARRWLTAYPGQLKHYDNVEAAERTTLAITSNPERLAELRKRLGSLSWFMKALNEPIARRANREDNCKGKFWESRYKCQALLEEHAVLSCMAYVDLNPVRAAICDTLIESDHTTIQRRLRERKGLIGRIKPRRSIRARQLKPVAGLDADALMAMTESSYIELVQWTGEQARWDKRGKLKPIIEGKQAAPADIWQIADNPKQWLRQVQGTESLYFRAIGSAEALMAKAAELGQVWMKGVASESAIKILKEHPT
ncbi:transposase [Wenzhouxiangella sp. AB-CW3]|uniref:transposase n=1 Tax=Wenzhouxiangella sp. AB-CW3 TaxID=2771012 RepID=UPI00168A6B4E|nr:transposase [Wenzhouxiangella sp. AB-CW3]QOC21577.1 transposase [Wenzhouxiangella sp. AB-CW3]